MLTTKEVPKGTYQIKVEENTITAWVGSDGKYAKDVITFKKHKNNTWRVSSSMSCTGSIEAAWLQNQAITAAFIELGKEKVRQNDIN